MKKYIYITFLILTGAFVLDGCKKNLETEGLSRVTYYPDFKFQGDEVMFVKQGSTFTEPGVTATENGKSINVSTTVTGQYTGYTGTTLNTSAADKYTISYNAVNKDGYTGSVTRTVYVFNDGDLVNSIEGLYKSTVVRNGVSAAQYTNMQYVLIYKTGNNTYNISDAIGGYYDLGRGYGTAYRATGGSITANNIGAGNFSFADYTVGSFGGTVKLSNMSTNPANKTLTFTAVWSSGYTFIVTLTQVPI